VIYHGRGVLLWTYDSLDDMKHDVRNFYSSVFFDSEEEVYYALHQCCGDKALGSDGMTIFFIEENWDTLKVDI